MKNTFWRIFFCLFLSGALLAAAPAGATQAQAGKDSSVSIAIDAHDNPLRMAGIFDEPTKSFSHNVRLTASGDVELLLLPSDLTLEGDTLVFIDRSKVTIPSGTQLSGGQPTDVTVTVSEVPKAGKYTGELIFVPSGQAPETGVKVAIELNAPDKVVVTAADPSLSVNLVRCQWPLDCLVAGWVLPDSATRLDWYVGFDNQTNRAVQVTSGSVAARGDRTGITLRPDDVKFTLYQELPARDVGYVKLDIQPNSLAADHYQGSLRFQVDGMDTNLPITFDLNVRDGPILPFLVILIGILFGRLIQKMESPAGQAQVKLLPEYYRLQNQTSRVNDAKARAYLDQRLRDFKTRLDSGKETEELLSGDLTRIGAEIEFMINLETLEQQLQPYDALNAELKPTVQATRQLVMAGKLEDAQTSSQEIAARLAEAQKDTSMSLSVKEVFNGVMNGLRSSSERMLAAVQPKEQPGGKRWNWLARLLAFLSGMRISSDVRYWLIRPLIATVLLVVLALLGLEILYVNAGATFGASGLYDYLGLFLWGITADVANRVITNVGELRPSNAAN